MKSLLAALLENDWMDSAKCRGVDDPELFFGPMDEPLGREASEIAKRVCNGTDEDGSLPCPVRQECLSYALRANERYGVWGGMDEVARRRVRREQRAREREQEAAAPPPTRTLIRRVVRKEWKW